MGKGRRESRLDGWANVITGLGRAGRDKRLGARIQVPDRITPMELTDLYAGDPLAARICDLPAHEMTRKWIHFESDAKGDSNKLVLQELDALDAQDAVCDALVWGRLYGGSILVVGADDGRPLDQPLNEDGIKSIEHLTVFDRCEVEAEWQWEGGRKISEIGRPEMYRIQTVGNNFLVHHSRVIRFDGVRTPRFRIQQNGGWTDSIFTRLLASLRDFWSSYDGAAHLLTDFSQAVFKVDNLATLIGSSQDDVVIKRLTALDWMRSVVRATVIDSKEDFERKATPVTGLPELLDQMQLLVSSITGIPVTLLMGRSPAGLQATGDADVRFFYDSIAAQQSTMLRPRLERLIKLLLLAKNGPTSGREPDNWSFDFVPLWQLTEKERAEVRRTHAEADSIDISNGVLHPTEVRQSRYSGDRYSTEITLDPLMDEADVLMHEAEPPADGPPDDGDEDPPPLEGEEG